MRTWPNRYKSRPAVGVPLSRILVPALALLALSACGPKTSAVAGPAADASGVGQARVPNDAASRSFATRLLDTPALNFRPTDGGGVQFSYDKLTFRSDNTWHADAKMMADGETIECVETGEWSMEAADDASTATMEWKLVKSTCPGRPADHVTRAKVQIADDGEYKVVFR